jgi:signal transduction histidine kinase
MSGIVKNKARGAMGINNSNVYKQDLAPEALTSVEETGQDLSKQYDPRRFRLFGDRGQANSSLLPWWRSSLIGYPAGLLLVAVTLVIALFYTRVISIPYFTGAPFFLTTVIIAWLWGASPALFVILLEFLGLEIFIVSPVGIWSFAGWIDLLMFAPWLLSQLAVAVITIQRETALQRLGVLEQELRARTDELAESNCQLEQANHLKDLFLSQASHELKTPITVIRGQVYLILRLLSKHTAEICPELMPLHTRLEKIDVQINRLQTLISDLLDLSSFQAMNLPLRLTECNFQSLCSEIVDDQRALSGRHFDLEMPSHPLTFQADCLRISQVITNLLSNAVKYSLEDSVIGVRISQEQSSVLLQVHNDGMAIPEEEQTTIFEPFYRLTNAQSSSEKGSGLGLSITKEIVERHGGQIWVESSEEQGTTFFVQLPF